VPKISTNTRHHTTLREPYLLCLNRSSRMAVHEGQLSVQCGRRTSRRGLSAWRGEGGSPVPPPPPPAAPLPPPTTGNLNESADAAAMFHLHQSCNVKQTHSHVVLLEPDVCRRSGSATSAVVRTFWTNRSALPLTTFFITLRILHSTSIYRHHERGQVDISPFILR